MVVGTSPPRIKYLGEDLERRVGDLRAYVSEMTMLRRLMKNSIDVDRLF